ncbi:hypothetical protein [Ruminococcus sp.]|uniref:hypothetical protein n=1 Tax=Ruminococcus sp. TaxID=41978 RepID=UPI00388FB1C1
MKHDKRVKEQNTPKGFHLYIEGPGRIDDSKSIDLAEEVAPDMMIDGQPAYLIGGSIPSRIKFSKEYGNTVYDVVADFSSEGKDTILKQFQKLILSNRN